MQIYVQSFKIVTPSFEGIVDTDDVSAVSIFRKNVGITKYSYDPSFESLVDAGALSFLSASLLTFEYLIKLNVKLLRLG